MAVGGWWRKLAQLQLTLKSLQSLHHEPTTSKLVDDLEVTASPYHSKDLRYSTIQLLFDQLGKDRRGSHELRENVSKLMCRWHPSYSYRLCLCEVSCNEQVN